MSTETLGFAQLENEIISAGLAGADVTISPAKGVVLLAEVCRLREMNRDARWVVRAVQSGRDCWASQQGYEPCEIRGAKKLLAGEPKRRPWWRLGR